MLNLTHCRSGPQRLTTGLLLVVLGSWVPAANGQLGATLVGHWDGFGGAYSDVYGDGDYAYIGHFGDAGLHILDISDPANPTFVAEVRADPPDQFASQQDLKVHNGLLFIALESDGNHGVLIVDVRDPTNPVKKTLITVQNYANVHNMYYDEGLLYLANSQTANVGIIDLRTYDPDAAPATITTPLWMLSNVGSSFVHDVHVRDVPVPGGGVRKLLYACAWNSGLWVYDATDVTSQAPTLIGTAPGQSVHSCWPTDDGKFIVTGEERSNGGIKVFEIGGTPTALSFSLRDSYAPSISEAFSVHNQLIDGYRLYNAWYQWGMVAFDIDPLTGALALVAHYDTFPDAVVGFDGAWGVYPFLGTDKVLVSDIEYGLFVVNVTGATSIDLPNGVPATVHPQQGTPVTVKVIEGGESVDPSSVTLHATVTGLSTNDILMTALGGSLYQADIPPVPCDASVDFYFTAETLGLQTIRNPMQAGAFYTLSPLTGVCENFRNNFETDLGWTVGAAGDNATAGIWLRGDPNGTTAQPEDDNPNGIGTQCYFTGQGPVGGAVGTADVDGGKTTLVSAVFPATADTSVGYVRWYSNDQGGAPNSDQMNIDISNNGGASWVPLEVVTENANAWVEKRFRISDFIAPTANMRLRFVADDANPGSVVEAAIDDFVLVEVVCSDPPGNTTIDSDLDLADYSGFDECMAGPGNSVAEGCCAYDTDLDDDVDMTDYVAIHFGFTGPA